jgi:hypothetical protein
MFSRHIQPYVGSQSLIVVTLAASFIAVDYLITLGCQDAISNL